MLSYRDDDRIALADERADIADEKAARRADERKEYGMCQHLVTERVCVECGEPLS